MQSGVMVLDTKHQSTTIIGNSTVASPDFHTLPGGRVLMVDKSDAKIATMNLRTRTVENVPVKAKQVEKAQLFFASRANQYSVEGTGARVTPNIVICSCPHRDGTLRIILAPVKRPEPVQILAISNGGEVVSSSEIILRTNTERPSLPKSMFYRKDSTLGLLFSTGDVDLYRMS